MLCRVCASERRTEFASEINLHFSGLKSLDQPGVFVFPRISVCMDCGFSDFKFTEDELALLANGRNQSSMGTEPLDKCRFDLRNCA
jgi:hypothetical protein